MTNDLDEMLDDLFDGCAFAALVEQAVEQGGPPDMEATKRRAFRFYEEALALKSSPADIGLTD